MSSFRKLIHEAHRRSLWQVLGIYLVSAWIAYEVVQSLTEGLGLPEWFPGFAVVLFIIGLPVVLATAFVQEGIRPESARAETVPAQADKLAPKSHVSGARRLLTWKNAIAGGVLAMALWGVVATGWFLLGRGDRPGDDPAIAADPNVVAVLPFRVAGADPALHYLREGMLDLLAAKLTGEGGPRAVDPRAVMSAWNRAAESSEVDPSDEEARRLGRDLGAAHVLLGGVVGTAGRVVINAALAAVDGEAVIAQASVEGPADSLTALVDELTAQLLAREAGEAPQRLAALTSTSLPALRAYLEGQATYREGRYLEAEQRFRAALEIDSKFALAALGYVAARYWTVNGFDPEGLRMAWNHRERLSQRDLALLIGLVGPDYPRASSWSVKFNALQRAVESSPDRPEGWYWLGEQYYHLGPNMGVAAAHDRAGEALQRAVELDSSFSGPLSHLIDLSIMRGDRSAQGGWLERYLEVNPTGEFRNYELWQSALAFGEAGTLDSVRALFPEMTTIALRAVVRTTQLKGFPTEDAEEAARLLRERSGTPSERVATLALLHDYALDRGRPSEALATMETFQQLVPGNAYHRVLVFDALYGGGDTTAALAAANELETTANAPLSEDAESRAQQFADICTLEQWRLFRGVYGWAAESIARLRRAEYPSDSSVVEDYAHTCGDLLEAMHATFLEQPGADALVISFDDKLASVPAGAYQFERLDRPGNLAVAHLLERHGDVEAAYRAVQRREFFVTRYLATYLREEGRLASHIGDRDAAVRAYRHYLTLRSEPEPGLMEEVEGIRAELGRLTAEAGAP
jgi:serine/threonine-protein kinase